VRFVLGMLLVLSFLPACSARLLAGTLQSRRCPPEGGRYIN